MIHHFYVLIVRAVVLLTYQGSTGTDIASMPRDIVWSICSTIFEIDATHVWYATIELLLIE